MFFTILKLSVFLLTLVQFTNNASLDISPDKYQRFTGDQGLYSQKDDVEILTVNNFKQAIKDSGKAWLVEFYNSWCGFCQRFAPSWKEFATDVRSWKDLVVVAAIDCANDQNYALCREYEIMAYPTLRYYHEGFEEAPKSYGFAINRGTSAEDHRHDLVRKIINEQKEGRGKQYPEMLPFFGSSVESLFEDLPSDTKYVVLIKQEVDSLIGPELVLDLHRIPGVATRYTYSNNTDLLSNFPNSGIPALYIVEKGQGASLLMTVSYDRKSVISTIKDSLKAKNVLISIEEDVKLGMDHYDKKMEVDALMDKVRRMGDVVFQMDLETALRYSLKREVGGLKDISGEKLQALRKYLHVLVKHFPFGRNGKALLQEISLLADSSDPVHGIDIAKLVKEAEKEDRQIFSTPQKWLGCQGSSTQFRGYPCGLWKMFHYLTINVADYEVGLRGDNPRVALEAMHGYIKNFFGCADCSQHFQDMAARREIDKVASFDDSILWLWSAHNEVNKRLSGDATEDPEFPKIQFPSEKSCSHCHKADGTWDLVEVLKFLKQMYSSVNVRYLGADTKVIYMGLEGNRTAPAGLQKEDVQIQARPVREGLAGVGTDGGSTSRSTAKDKANFKFLFYFMFTVFVFI